MKLKDFLFGPAKLTTREWQIGGVARKALIYLPDKTENAPVIFAFHGHGGQMELAAKKFTLHTLWPEAIVIYPQGLPTKTQRDRWGRFPGWQIGWSTQNRDLALFEALLETVQKEWKGDSKRLYAMGHSNGAGFVYYLWGKKPELFAALAAASGMGERLLATARPCPVMPIGSKSDPIVRWPEQEAVIETAKRVNGSTAPVEVVLHNEGHNYPNDASARIIAFFKKHPKK
jgi:polyhydroxybutyrate depolymerase